MGMATTIFLWMRVSSAHEKFKSAIIISGLVTFIAAYHYMRIFNSWVEAYEWQKDGTVLATTSPFNDALRYMDWLLTVPLLLIEIILVMELPAQQSKRAATKLGVASALMIILGYPGELVKSADDQLVIRWACWFAAMLPFCYIVHALLVRLREATQAETDPEVRDLIQGVQIWTVMSWCAYPMVYLLPMLGVSDPSTVVYIQLGYSNSDIISKCGVGLMIYQIAMAKTAALQKKGGCVQ